MRWPSSGRTWRRCWRADLLPPGSVDVLLTTTSFQPDEFRPPAGTQGLGRADAASDLLLQQRKRLGRQHRRAVAARRGHERRPAGVRRPHHHDRRFLQEHADARCRAANGGRPLSTAGRPSEARRRPGAQLGAAADAAEPRETRRHHPGELSEQERPRRQRGRPGYAGELARICSSLCARRATTPGEEPIPAMGRRSSKT